MLKEDSGWEERPTTPFLRGAQGIVLRLAVGRGTGLDTDEAKSTMMAAAFQGDKELHSIPELLNHKMDVRWDEEPVWHSSFEAAGPGRQNAAPKSKRFNF